MKHIPLTLTSLALLAGTSWGQSQEIYSIPRPAGASFAWGESLNSLDDLTGDGVPEILIGGVNHGGGPVASVHSGADGTLLFQISVPFQAMFYGDGFTPLGDRNGDGIPEIVVIGSRSGDSHSFEGELRIHSGADGSTLQVFRPPTNVNFVSHGEWYVTNLGDMDGDGSDDILCRTSGSGTGFSGATYSLFSSANGQVLYHVANPTGNSLFEGVAVLADHDGDGLRDIALARRNSSGSANLVVISGATGQVISERPVPELAVLTGNREPFLAVRDTLGKGASHVAFGGVFSGALGKVSTQSGQVDWHTTCNQNASTCFGSRMIDVGDVNNDGHSDLLALESRIGGTTALQLQLVDGLTGSMLMEEDTEGLAGGYAISDRIQAMPGIDPQGFPTFALNQEANLRISMRRLMPELGTMDCFAKVNSTGLGATLRAEGSASRSAASLELKLGQAPAGAFAVFIQGDVKTRQPFGDGLLCVGGHGSRIGYGLVDSAGQLSLSVDLSAFPPAPGGWIAQTLFRDTQGTGLNSSNSLTLDLQP